MSAARSAPAARSSSMRRRTSTNRASKDSIRLCTSMRPSTVAFSALALSASSLPFHSCSCASIAATYGSVLDIGSSPAASGYEARRWGRAQSITASQAWRSARLICRCHIPGPLRPSVYERQVVAVQASVATACMALDGNQALLACDAAGEPSGKAGIQTPLGSGSEVRDLAIDVHADAARDPIEIGRHVQRESVPPPTRDRAARQIDDFDESLHVTSLRRRGVSPAPSRWGSGEEKVEKRE